MWCNKMKNNYVEIASLIYWARCVNGSPFGFSFENKFIFVIYYLYFVSRHGGYNFCRCCSARSGTYCCHQCTQFSEKWRTLCHINQGGMVDHAFVRSLLFCKLFTILSLLTNFWPLFTLDSGKLHRFYSGTCCCICWRSEKDASWENEATGTVNTGALWKRSCCCCWDIQVKIV